MNRRFYWRIVSFLLTISLASTFFFLLFRYDNKYTSPAMQPQRGALAITQADLEETPLRFLRDGWAFYADSLLSPIDLHTISPTAYITIGQYTRFDQPNGNPHGSGSYALRLDLPEEAQSYSIELPEIYSSYRFYVNDVLMAQRGEPDPYQYRDETQTNAVTFRVSGTTTLLLAVSDYSHFYSGLTYPPAFGVPTAVAAISNLRVSICLIYLTVTFLAAIFAFYLSARMKHHNAALFGTLCLSSIGYVCYSALHFFWALPIQPWYTIELSSGYLMTFFVVFLHGRICKTDPNMALCANSITAVFCVLAFLYGGFAAYLTVPLMRVFSFFLVIYKIFVALYLLVTAGIALYRRIDTVWSLFYADLFFACSYLWDIILSNYEPIYSGWFTEWGVLAVIFALGSVLWRDMTDAYRYNLAFAEEHRQVKRQLSMQTELFHQLSDQVEESRRLRHDFRQHLRTILELSKQGQRDKLVDYIGQIAEVNGSTLHVSFCENIPVDALLHYYYAVAVKNEIDMTARVSLPEKIGVSDIELCTILGNLMENAVEACQRQTEGEKLIRVWSRCNGGGLILVLDNSYDGTIEIKRGKFLSRKHNGPGIGVESVREIVARYDGVMDIRPSNILFQVELSLPIDENTV